MSLQTNIFSNSKTKGIWTLKFSSASPSMPSRGHHCVESDLPVLLDHNDAETQSSNPVREVTTNACRSKEDTAMKNKGGLGP